MSIVNRTFESDVDEALEMALKTPSNWLYPSDDWFEAEPEVDDQYTPPEDAVMARGKRWWGLPMGYTACGITVDRSVLELVMAKMTHPAPVARK